MQTFSKPYRAWLLTILLVSNALNLADRLGMAAVSQAIKNDLRFTDAQMGLIQGLGFAILYTLLGLPIARLAEHTNRTRIIAGSLAIFGAMAWLCSTATSFARLLLFRVGVSVGDAGFGPPVASLVGDHYPMEKRASVMSIIWLGAPLGVVVGSNLGGWMAEHVSWRAAFVAIGIPGLLVSVLAFLTLREPPRGMSDAAAAGHAPSAGPVASAGSPLSAGPAQSAGPSLSAGPAPSAGPSLSAGPAQPAGPSLSAGLAPSAGPSLSAGPVPSAESSPSPGPVPSAGPPPSFQEVLKFLLAKRSMCHILVGCALAAIGMNAIGQFLAPFLIRNYHLGFAQTGRLLSLIAGGAMASGLALGGFGVDWAGRIDKRWYVWGPAIGLMVAAPAFLVGFVQNSLTSAVAILMVAHLALFVYFTPTLAMAQNMVGANMRASSAFTVSLVLGLIGVGIGPTLLGFLSDVFAKAAFAAGNFKLACPGGAPPHGTLTALQESCAAASATGIRHAMMAVSVFLLWAAVHYFLAARTLRADLLRRHVALPTQ